MNPKDWPAMPDEITRDGPYRVYKGGRYAVYDDGNSAETPYQTDRAEALEARLRTTAEALRGIVDAHARNTLYNGAGHWDAARAVLAQLEQEGMG